MVHQVNNQPPADNETATTDEDLAVNIDVTDGDDFGLDGAGIRSIAVTTPEVKTNDLGNTGVDPSTLSLPDTGSAVSEQDTDTFNITTIAIADLNTPPVNTVPTAQTTGESAPDVFADVVFSNANGNAIAIADSEADPATDTVEVTNELQLTVFSIWQLLIT